MHSLALSALRRANLLSMFPAGPIILDEWEQRNIFDTEFAKQYGCTPGRAKKIRVAYDAYWQTLQVSQLNQVSPVEQSNFVAFYSQFTTFYSCILAGEVVRRCVENVNAGTLQPSVLQIGHLIVDEFQDLNACDQEFIRGVATSGANLWVSGDDDQSIYSFRHADSSGIQGFLTDYPGAVPHVLSDCFRCSTEVLATGLRVIAHNPSPPRVRKALVSLYAASAPPVQGRVEVWRTADGYQEARFVAESCGSLIAAGVTPEDILVLLSDRRSQLQLLDDAFRAAGIPYAAPKGPAAADEPAGRLVLALLRIVELPDDYAAHRDLLELQHGVGVQTCLDIENSAVVANVNFRALFYAPLPTGVFSSRCVTAIHAVSAVCQHIQTWQVLDDILSHDQAILQLIDHVFSPGSANHGAALADWQPLRATLPDLMTLEELLAYLRADSEVEQLQVLGAVHQRLRSQSTASAVRADRVRILTMHGAKGLEGKIVFIPGFEQEMMPGRHAAANAGLVQERRRLLYTSITRAKACCILTFANSRSGASAQSLSGQWQFRPAPSQFIAEVGIQTQARTSSVASAEVAAIVQDCANL